MIVRVLLPHESLPSFIWPIVGILLLVCLAASAYRFVVHQILAADRELAAQKLSKSSTAVCARRR
jgi:hypothetical protein